LSARPGGGRASRNLISHAQSTQSSAITDEFTHLPIYIHMHTYTLYIGGAWTEIQSQWSHLRAFRRGAMNTAWACTLCPNMFTTVFATARNHRLNHINMTLKLMRGALDETTTRPINKAPHVERTYPNEPTQDPPPPPPTPPQCTPGKKTIDPTEPTQDPPPPPPTPPQCTPGKKTTDPTEPTQDPPPPPPTPPQRTPGKKTTDSPCASLSRGNQSTPQKMKKKRPHHTTPTSTAGPRTKRKKVPNSSTLPLRIDLGSTTTNSALSNIDMKRGKFIALTSSTVSMPVHLCHGPGPVTFELATVTKQLVIPAGLLSRRQRQGLKFASAAIAHEKHMGRILSQVSSGLFAPSITSTKNGFTMPRYR
jgi:hypothetical protein